MKKKPTSKKLNKSTKYYLICGGLAVAIIIGLLFLYAYLTGVDLGAMFTSKYAFIIYGALIIYVTIGLTLILSDRIGRM